MWYQQHCKRCLDVLGDEFNQVNLWLDELAHRPITGPPHDDKSGRPYFDPHHRKYRHNHEGIEYVLRTWGQAAAEAAKLHILDDFFGPCPHTLAQEEQIPLNEQDYTKKGWH